MPTYEGSYNIDKIWNYLDKCSKKDVFQFSDSILDFGKLHKVFCVDF